MILNDRQIKELAGRGMIQPFHSSKVDGKGILSYGLEPFGYTLTLANKHYKVVVCTNPVKRKLMRTFGFLSLFWEWPKLREVDRSPQRKKDKHFVTVPPNSFILVTTNEKLTMPTNVQGQFLTKSTLARMGLFANVTWIDAGWSGYLTVEIANLGGNEIRIPCDEGIGQIVFYAGNEPENAYKGRYQNQHKVAQEAIM